MSPESSKKLLPSRRRGRRRRGRRRRRKKEKEKKEKEEEEEEEDEEEEEEKKQKKKKTKKMFVTVFFGPLIIQREVTYRGQLTTPPDTADLLQLKYVLIESVWRFTASVRYWMWRLRRSQTVYVEAVRVREIRPKTQKGLPNNLTPTLQNSNITSQPGKVLIIATQWELNYNACEKYERNYLAQHE